MGNEKIKDLAKAYARRELSTSEYRRLRSELLDELTITPTIDDAANPESLASNDAQMSDDRSSTSTKGNPESRVVATLIQFCLLIALILGFFYFFK